MKELRRCLMAALIVAEVGFGCKSGDGSTQPIVVPPTASPSPSWSQIGPEGAFVGAVQFHPTRSGEAWMALDDSGGIFKSTDAGASWTLMATPPNLASVAIGLVASSPNLVLIPTYYGQGILSTTNAGTSWSLAAAGLPAANGSDKTVDVHDFAIHPSQPLVMVAATGAGLYRSTDGGVTFHALTSWSGDFRAVAFHPGNGRLYAGSYAGLVQVSADNGDSWSPLLPGAIPVASIRATTNAIYIAFSTSDTFCLTTAHASCGQINVAATGITNTGPKVPLVVLSGASQAQDHVYLGSAGNSSVPSTRWGVFRSINGGSSWTQLSNGLQGISVFSLAVDPTNEQRILVGSLNSAGIFRSVDGGASFQPSSPQLKRNYPVALAQDPANASHLFVSSSSGAGYSRSWTTSNGGGAWSIAPEIDDQDGTLGFDFSPLNSNTVLGGTNSKGLYRSTNGASGPWARVISANVRVDRLARDRVDTSTVYALATTAPNLSDPGLRIYVSTNDGASFTIRPTLYGGNIRSHPTHQGEAVFTSVGDAFASGDRLASVTSLGLTAQATAQGGLTAIEFDDQNPSTIYVGGASGGLFRTTGYGGPGAPSPSWTTLNTPFKDALVREIRVVHRGSKTVIYAAAAAIDVYRKPGSIMGLYRSVDGGSTWTNLTAGFSVTQVWQLLPSLTAPTTNFFVGFYGMGLMKLVDP